MIACVCVCLLFKKAFRSCEMIIKNFDDAKKS